MSSPLSIAAAEFPPFAQKREPEGPSGPPETSKRKRGFSPGSSLPAFFAHYVEKANLVCPRNESGTVHINGNIED
jgi:hypothetical protein